MTKRLSRNEVVELIKNTINDCHYKKEGGWSIEDEAKEILQALETNGILCLVEGEAKEGDFIWHDIDDAAHKVVGIGDKGQPYVNIEGDWQEHYWNSIVLRNSIPAYHCKQETQGAE